MDIESQMARLEEIMSLYRAGLVSREHVEKELGLEPHATMKPPCKDIDAEREKWI